MQPKLKSVKKRKIILVTADFSGLGFVIQDNQVNPDNEVVIALGPKEVKVRPIIKIKDKVYTGKDHGMAIEKAHKDGVKREINREKEGLFLVNDSRILTRDEAMKEFKFNHSEDIPVEMQIPYEDAIDEFSKGVAKVFPLKELMDKRKKLKDYYWIFDSNHNWEDNELLRKEGFKVFGGGELNYKLENEREFGTEYAKSCGLESPETQEFKSIEDGIKFLESREDEAFVFKANGSDDCSLTYPPLNIESAKANEEIRHNMKAQDVDDFILQKRVEGTEVNVEFFVMNGEPVLAQANLEDKKPMEGDDGDAVGCAFDVCWQIPLDCKLVEMTVGKFRKKLKELKYTGFCDANVIIDDERAHFLEFCYRWGYSAHPNFFYNLSKVTALEFACQMIDGTYKPEETVLDGFGASITLFAHKPRKGLTVYIPPALENCVYLFEGYKEEGLDMLLMSGLNQEIAIVTARHFTITTAFEKCLEYANQVIFKSVFKRKDAHKTDYPLSPLRRYESLQARKLI